MVELDEVSTHITVIVVKCVWSVSIESDIRTLREERTGGQGVTRTRNILHLASNTLQQQ